MKNIGNGEFASIGPMISINCLKNKLQKSCFITTIKASRVPACSFVVYTEIPTGN